jgi:hypothetical protein
MRSKVSTYEQIRRAHDREGLSIRALARRFRVHRRDVRRPGVGTAPAEKGPGPGGAENGPLEAGDRAVVGRGPGHAP